MTWTRLSDDFTDKLDLLGLSRSARLLEVEALVWCNRNTTDGYLPRAALRKVTDSPDPEGDIAELVAAGRWDDVDTGWQLDWSDQESAQAVNDRRDEWRRRDERRRKHNKGDHSLCDPKRCWALTRETTRETRSETTGDSRPPVPVPVPLPTPREGRDGKDAGARSAGATRAAASEEGTAPRVAGHEYEQAIDDFDADGNEIPLNDVPWACDICGLPPSNGVHRIPGHHWLAWDDEGVICAVCRQPHDEEDSTPEEDDARFDELLEQRLRKGHAYDDDGSGQACRRCHLGRAHIQHLGFGEVSA